MAFYLQGIALVFGEHIMDSIKIKRVIGLLNEITLGQNQTLDDKIKLTRKVIEEAAWDTQLFVCSQCGQHFDFSKLADNQDGDDPLWCIQCDEMARSEASERASDEIREVIYDWNSIH